MTRLRNTLTQVAPVRTYSDLLPFYPCAEQIDRGFDLSEDGPRLRLCNLPHELGFGQLAKYVE